MAFVTAARYWHHDGLKAQWGGNLLNITRRQRVLACCLLFLLALLPRAYSALTVGWGWDGPGSFQLVNFDEAGSCRAALDGFAYSPFVGYQTLALSQLAGLEPASDAAGNARAVQAFCHSPQHLLIARMYSAVLGAATAVVVVLLGLQLLPQRPQIAWTAGLLLALSGFHMAESHKATVDVPSVFFIYSFLAYMVFALRRGGAYLWFSPLFLVPAMWAKYWLFAIFSYLAWLPQRVGCWLRQAMNHWQLFVLIAAAALVFAIATNAEFQRHCNPLWLGLFYLFVPWRRLSLAAALCWLCVPLSAYGLSQWPLFAAYTTGGLESRFGTGYGAIGWHKLLRNMLNVPVVLLLGLGIPGFVFAIKGIISLPQVISFSSQRLWWLLLPVVLCSMYLLVLMPVTYYRHYLPLLPAAALLAALGLWGRAGRPPLALLVLFFVWPALLAVDLVADYHRDPRIALRQWFAQQQPATAYYSYYVNPPPVAGLRLFHPELLGSSTDFGVDWLILSENWYDTAFASELNGPVVNRLERLIKTTPERASFYRQALADEHASLQPVERFEVFNFMPELVLHKRWYGTFQMFVGDIWVFKLLPPAPSAGGTMLPSNNS